MLKKHIKKLHKDRVVDYFRSKEKIINWKCFWISLIITTAFYFWEIFIIKVPHVEWLQHAFERYNLKYFIVLLFTYLFFYFLTFLYFYTTFISSTKVKVFSLIFFAVIILGQYGYVNALNRFVNPVDLEIAFLGTDLTVKRDAIIAYLSWKSLVPILVFGCVAFTRNKKETKISPFLFFGVLLLNLIIIIGATLVFNKPKLFIKDIPRLNAINAFFYTTYKATVYFVTSYGIKRENLAGLREPVFKPKKNIIFIIDESLRARNMSLYGYERETTPYLKQLYKENNLKKIKSAIAGTTCSVSSGNLLFTGMSIDELPDTEFNVFKRPTIEQYAKKVGYKTYFLDGQMNSYWRGTSDDIKYTDYWKSNKDFGKKVKNQYNIDFEIAKQTVEIIKSSKGNFIWIWKRGVHFPYHDDFPNNQAFWKPISNSVRLDSITKNQLLNTYDNAIKYNVDKFLEILAPEVLADSNNVLIYSSDHGQNLLEGQSIVTHCSSSKNEVDVPLFMITSDNSLNLNSNYKATHANIFPTLLDLMNVPKYIRKYKYADSLLDVNAKHPETRFYWGMDLTSGEKHQYD